MKNPDDHVYFLLIGIVIVFIVNGIFHILRDSNEYYMSKKNDKKWDEIAVKVFDIVDIILFVSGIYLLFFRQSTTPYIILSIILIIKAINHFSIRFEIYERLFDQKTQDKILYIAKIQSKITDYGMFLVSLYLLNKIFYS